MARLNTAFLLVLLAAAALAAACGPDRFTDSGCKTDGDCRGDRVCVEGLCVGEGRAPDAGEDADGDTGDDGGADVVDQVDTETLDIGTEEDANDAELEAFLGEWGLEGPVTVLTEDGEVLQETDPQPFPTRIERGEQTDLFIDIEPIDGCTLLADATSQTQFEVQPLDCESSPVGEVQGDATVLAGEGLLIQDGDALQMELRIQIESMDFGIIVLDLTLRGPRLAP